MLPPALATVVETALLPSQSSPRRPCHLLAILVGSSATPHVIIDIMSPNGAEVPPLAENFGTVGHGKDGEIQLPSGGEEMSQHRLAKGVNIWAGPGVYY